MSKLLAVYIRDHLAGSKMAIDLLGDMRDRHTGKPLGEFAREMLVEVEADRKVLKELLEHLDGGRSNLVKEALAWLVEKMSRFKLRRRSNGELGTLLALETLGLGILGKLGLWQAFRATEIKGSQFPALDFTRLAARAEEQHQRVEKRRLEAAERLIHTLER